MDERLERVWSRARVVQVVDGGEFDGPIPDRTVLATLPVDAARTLTTEGRFTGDICRCPGGLTIVLRDGTDRILAGGSLHGYGRVSWERSRWRDDLDVADPAGLHILLAAHGVPGQLAQFFAPLSDLLDLHEGDRQFRRAGKAGLRDLAARGVPEVLHPVLAGVSGEQAGQLPPPEVDAIRRLLTDAVPAEVDRAGILLSWLGRLPVLAEAFWGDGALVRRLLAEVPVSSVATAAAGTGSGHVVMGVVNLVMHTDDDGTLAGAVVPALRRLFPPER
jgi:hypothetical protein